MEDNVSRKKYSKKRWIGRGCYIYGNLKEGERRMKNQKKIRKGEAKKWNDKLHKDVWGKGKKE